MKYDLNQYWLESPSGDSRPAFTAAAVLQSPAAVNDNGNIVVVDKDSTDLDKVTVLVNKMAAASADVLAAAQVLKDMEYSNDLAAALSRGVIVNFGTKKVGTYRTLRVNSEQDFVVLQNLAHAILAAARLIYTDPPQQPVARKEKARREIDISRLEKMFKK